MKEEWKQALREMKAEGYAVIVWTPDEMGDIDPEWIEDASISYGNEYLIDYEFAKKKGEEGNGPR
jgi:hypothetical protein